MTRDSQDATKNDVGRRLPSPEPPDFVAFCRKRDGEPPRHLNCRTSSRGKNEDEKAKYYATRQEGRMLSRDPVIGAKGKVSRIGVGVVGYGYWGPNLVRNFAESDDAQVLAVSDLSANRLMNVRRQRSVRTCTDYREILAMPDVDAVVIATPVHSHFDIALAALRAGKHVLVEKPMTQTAEQAERLIEEAANRRLILMVDHTFVYTPAVGKMREIIASDALGDIFYYDSIRVNLGLFQRDVNVIWDLAVHDFSIIDYLFDDRAVAVSANGASHVPDSPENIAYISVFFASGMIAHVNVNWLAPVKVRRTLIGGSRKMIVFDDLEPSEKVKVYDKGVTVTDDTAEIRRLRIGYRAGDMWAPQLSTKEALRTGAEHFIACIGSGSAPITDGAAGLRVVRILEATTRSMQRRGDPVELAARVQERPNAVG
jgi:predicted dehydrogenase